jgi:hypothetical protein
MPVYWVLPECLRLLSVQAGRLLPSSGPLLIRGSGVRVPGGAPAKIQLAHVSSWNEWPHLGRRKGMARLLAGLPAAGRGIMPGSGAELHIGISRLHVPQRSAEPRPRLLRVQHHHNPAQRQPWATATVEGSLPCRL